MQMTDHQLLTIFKSTSKNSKPRLRVESLLKQKLKIDYNAIEWELFMIGFHVIYDDMKYFTIHNDFLIFIVSVFLWRNSEWPGYSITVQHPFKFNFVIYYR